MRVQVHLQPESLIALTGAAFLQMGRKLPLDDAMNSAMYSKNKNMDVQAIVAGIGPHSLHNNEKEHIETEYPANWK